MKHSILWVVFSWLIVLAFVARTYGEYWIIGLQQSCRSSNVNERSEEEPACRTPVEVITSRPASALPTPDENGRSAMTLQTPAPPSTNRRSFGRQFQEGHNQARGNYWSPPAGCTNRRSPSTEYRGPAGARLTAEDEHYGPRLQNLPTKDTVEKVSQIPPKASVRATRSPPAKHVHCNDNPRRGKTYGCLRSVVRTGEVDDVAATIAGAKRDFHSSCSSPSSSPSNTNSNTSNTSSSSSSTNNNNNGHGVNGNHSIEMAKSCSVLDVQQTQALFSQGRQARKSPARAVRRSKLPYTPSSSTRTPARVIVRAVKTPAPTTSTKKPSPLAPSPSSTPAAPIRALPPASPRRPTVPLASTGKRQRDGEGLQKPEETRAERMKAGPRRLQNIVPVPTTATTPTASTIITSTPTTTAAITASTIIAATITASTPTATAITATTATTITAATSCSEKDVKTIAAAKKIAEVHCCHQPQHENEGWVRVPYLSDEDGGKEVAGAFVHLPVTILPPTCGQVCDEGTVYVRPGGGPPTQEWYHEDQRVVWKVPKSTILDKVSAGKGAKCDACHDDRRGCSWTPDGLELLCTYCADAPRREVGDYRELRGYGQFAWASACDCNC